MFRCGQVLLFGWPRDSWWYDAREKGETAVRKQNHEVVRPPSYLGPRRRCGPARRVLTRVAQSASEFRSSQFGLNAGFRLTAAFATACAGGKVVPPGTANTQVPAAIQCPGTVQKQSIKDGP